MFLLNTSWDKLYCPLCFKKKPFVLVSTKIAILTVIFTVHVKSLGWLMAWKEIVYTASCASLNCISCIFYGVPGSYFCH